MEKIHPVLRSYSKFDVIGERVSEIGKLNQNRFFPERKLCSWLGEINRKLIVNELVSFKSLALQDFYRNGSVETICFAIILRIFYYRLDLFRCDAWNILTVFCLKGNCANASIENPSAEMRSNQGHERKHCDRAEM